jgi:hypothetical protein
MKNLSHLLILLSGLFIVFSNLEAQAQRIGGTNGPDISVNRITYLLSYEQNILKSALTSYLRSMKIEEIKDSVVYQIFNGNPNGNSNNNSNTPTKNLDLINGKSKIEITEFIKDIESSDYIEGKTGSCHDEFDKAVLASAGLDDLGGNICFDIPALAKATEKMELEPTMNFLAAIVMHEHLHHFQKIISETNEKIRLQKIKQTEGLAYRLSTYVLVTARASQTPSLKWSQDVESDQAFCTEAKQKIHALNLKIKTQTEIVSLWNDLSTEATNTHDLSFNIGTTSALLGLPLSAIATSILGSGMFFSLTSTMVTINIVDSADLHYLDNDIFFYAKMDLKTIARIYNKLEIESNEINLDWSKIANALTQGKLADKTIRHKFEIENLKLKLLNEEVILRKLINEQSPNKFCTNQ